MDTEIMDFLISIFTLSKYEWNFCSIPLRFATKSTLMLYFLNLEHIIRKIQRRHTWTESDDKRQFLKKKASTDFLKVLSELNSDDDDEDATMVKVEPRKR